VKWGKKKRKKKTEKKRGEKRSPSIYLRGCKEKGEWKKRKLGKKGGGGKRSVKEGWVCSYSIPRPAQEREGGGKEKLGGGRGGKKQKKKALGLDTFQKGGKIQRKKKRQKGESPRARSSEQPEKKGRGGAGKGREENMRQWEFGLVQVSSSAGTMGEEGGGGDLVKSGEEWQNRELRKKGQR